MALFENKLRSMSRGVSTRRASARRAIARKIIAVSAAFIVLIGCGGGGGGGGAPAANTGGGGGGVDPRPSVTFRTGNSTTVENADQLTALTAGEDNVAHIVNIAGNMQIDRDDTMDGVQPTLDLTAAIDAGGNPPAPTGDALAAETVAQRLLRSDELRITSAEPPIFAGGVVGDITNSPEPTTAGDSNLNIQNFEAITLDGRLAIVGNVSNGDTATIYTFLRGIVDGTVRGGSEADDFIVAGNIVEIVPIPGATSDSDEFALLDFAELLDGAGGDDTFWLNAGGVVNNIVADAGVPAEGSGDMHLQNFETIIINGGTARGDVSNGDDPTTYDMRSGTLGIPGDLDSPGGSIRGGGGIDTFELQGGTIDGDVNGGGGNDIFNLYSAVTINGVLDGGADTDVLNYAGAPAGNAFAARGGLADDADITDPNDSVANIESQADVPAVTSLGNTGAGAGLRGLTVSGIEVLAVAPALNLYGAMSDALMQFGQQTASGFGLADLDLSTGGRGTSLVSKDSPFSKGKIWAHQIKHSGGGKGTIGLNITGLTARADSDYDYEMTLNQHGFDAPLATSKWGALKLRAVSHTMTGVIETNVAEANVTGYGAGLAMMWNNETLSAHITSLAGAYEVEAHTSPLNPQAVVSEITEGSFSAINAVVSAGVADTRKLGHSLVLRTTADIVWQTLSLDDFSETGPDGIAINFDKATRFTAQVGAGLEAEHWFSDVVFVHETSSGGTLSSGLSQDYRQDDGTAIEMKLGGKIADLATGLTLKAYAGLRTSLINGATLEPSARFDLSWRF